MSISEDRAESSVTETENDAIQCRRAAAGVDSGAAAIGLALSGGGIRSATFCAGLLRALARNRVLHRFDYLSTVAGGGYIGAALGRLFHAGADHSPADVEAGVAKDDSLFLWWLRNNGRFLAPAGVTDLIHTIASHVRGFLATQAEVIVLMLLFACAITLPHLAYSWVFALREGMPFAVSLWWWLIPIPAAATLTLCYGFWFLGKENGSGLATSLLATATGAYFAVQARNTPESFDAVLLAAVAFVLLPAPLGWIVARMSGWLRSEGRNRVRYTNALAWFMKATVLLLALGLLDMLSWFLKILLSQLVNDEAAGSLAIGVAITTLLIGVVRFGLPTLQTANKGGVTFSLDGVANIAGVLLVMGIALFWTTIFQAIIFPEKGDAFGDFLRNAYVRWAIVAAISLVYLLLNGRAVQQLNRSSLHFFYRSRIARAYVSVGNTGSAGSVEPRFPANPLATNTRELTERTVKITRVIDDDDMPMDAYAPHRKGGPIHLINCCINQTVDDRTGTYNADRKGILLTVSALGVETGTHGPATGSSSLLAGSTLAEWIAISGAAVGSGMGSHTRPGMAALAFLSGLRLGYWKSNLSVVVARRRSLVAKYGAVLREMFAHFPGLRSAHWYLSDGGHFDNTGVYALLKRQLPLIVLADCGPDPDYRYADVENLVRKARIDYAARIEFVDPAGLAPVAGSAAAFFGTAETISSAPGGAHLLLARITYASGARGALLVVKPRISNDLPLDVASYGERETSFPQQPTSNQFFSEEQWESYAELGALLGAPLTARLLDSVTAWAWTAPPIGGCSTPAASSVQAPSRMRRIATTVGTSIGIGALLTGLLAGWQALDVHRQQVTQQQTATNAEVQRLNDEARNLLTFLSAPERQAEGFSTAIDAQVNLLTSSIGDVVLSDQQVRTMQDLGDLLTPICARSIGELATRCSRQWLILGSSGHRSDSAWDEAMANYKGWRDPAAVSFVLGEAVVANAADASGAARAEVMLACGQAKQTFMLYPRIYDESQRAELVKALAMVRELGIIVPGIENVTDMAERNQQRRPFKWKSPTVFYAPEGKACATALVRWANLALPVLAAVPAKTAPITQGQATGNVLELWVPQAK